MCGLGDTLSQFTSVSPVIFFSRTPSHSIFFRFPSPRLLLYHWLFTACIYVMQHLGRLTPFPSRKSVFSCVTNAKSSRSSIPALGIPCAATCSAHCVKEFHFSLGLKMAVQTCSYSVHLECLHGFLPIAGRLHSQQTRLKAAERNNLPAESIPGLGRTFQCFPLFPLLLHL